MSNIKHRTQISLDEWQYQLLIEESKKNKQSISSIIRAMLSDNFSKQTSLKKDDPIFNIIGIGKGDGTAVARDHDKFLYQKK